MWDLRNGNILWKFNKDESAFGPTIGVFNQDGKKVIISGNMGTWIWSDNIYLVNSETGEIISFFHGHVKFLLDASISPDDVHLAIGGDLIYFCT